MAVGLTSAPPAEMLLPVSELIIGVIGRSYAGVATDTEAGRRIGVALTH